MAAGNYATELNGKPVPFRKEDFPERGTDTNQMGNASYGDSNEPNLEKHLKRSRASLKSILLPVLR